MFTLYFLMTRQKLNKYSNSSKVNGNYVAVPLTSELTTSQISSDLDQLTKGKEKVLWHTIGLFEKSFVQAVAREMGIRFVED
tara:strand:+ start:383 stop:628 length:246 start_codon:yes stop_codon:yes gene_type:complete